MKPHTAGLTINIAFVLLIPWAGRSALAAAPKVVETVPANGDQKVDPGLREIRVTFDQDMSRGGYSWVGGGPTYPKSRGKPRWVNARTCVLPIRIMPNHEYWLSVNNNKFKNFRSASGQPAIPHPISFKTAGKGGGEISSEASDETDVAEEDRIKSEPLKFSLVDVFGRQVTSDDYAGVPVAVMAGACWCGGCQQDARPFVELAAEYAPRGVQFIRSVSCDDELAALEFQKHYRMPMVQLMDTNRTFEKQYNRDGWTFLMLVDRDGKVVYRANSPDLSKLGPQLDALIATPVDQKPIVRDGVPYLSATLARSGETDAQHRRDEFPSIACDSKGRVHVVFTSNRNGNSDVFLRTFDGKKWSKDKPVAAGEDDEFDATVIVDRADRAWISWTSDADGLNYNVFTATLDEPGDSVKPAQVTEASDDAMHARMTCDRKGRVWLTYYKWHKMRGRSRDKEVYLRHRDGRAWSDEIRVSPTDVPEYEDHTEPTIVAGQDGVVVGWSWDFHKPDGYTKDAEAPTIFLRAIGSDLELGPIRHASGTAIENTPTLAMDGKNRLWCAWDGLTWDGRLNSLRSSVYVCRLDLSAPRPREPQRLTPPSLHNVCTPQLLAGPDGRLTLLWSQRASGSRWTLERADLDTGRNRWATSKIVASRGNPRFASAAYDSQGGFWVAYSADADEGRRIIVKQLETAGE